MSLGSTPSCSGGKEHLTGLSIDLRLQLLEPDRYPHLYKCLYGLLMLLPQSSAFAALKNRLNSVSSIGYLHIAPRAYVASTTIVPSTPSTPHSRQGSVVEAIQSLQQQQQQQQQQAQQNGQVLYPRISSKFGGMETHALASLSNATTPSGSNFDRPNRLKGREEGIIRWNELLEKFRNMQERARRAQRVGNEVDDGPGLGLGDLRIGDGGELKPAKDIARTATGPPVPLKDAPTPVPPQVKPRLGLGRQFGKFGGAVAGRGKRNP